MMKTQLKRRFSYLAAIALVLSAIFCAVLMSTRSALAAKSKFSAGSGTAEDPFVVSTVEEFFAVESRPDAYFVQAANLDFTGREFYPLGDLTHPFTGHYDGNQYMLTGIEAVFPEKDNVGVFSFVYGNAVIENLRVERSTFSGKQNVGAIAGINAGRIEGAVANAEITASRNAAGGVAGTNAGIIFHSVNQGSVKAVAMYGGGITGVNTGRIAESYHKGTAAAGTYAGGIAGMNHGKDGDALIERTFNVGSVEGNVKANIAGDNMNGAIAQSRFPEKSPADGVSAFNTGRVSASMARPAFEFKSRDAFGDWAGFDDSFMFIPGGSHPILRAEYVEVSEVRFEAESELTLRPGDEFLLETTVFPRHASVQTVTLTLDTGSELCVLEGNTIKVSPDAEVGSFITVTAEADGVVGLLSIKIVPIRVERVALSAAENRTNVAPGGSLAVEAVVYPQNATNREVRFVSSSPFADIDAYGRLTVSDEAPVGLTFTVTAFSYDNIEIRDEIAITVTEARIHAVEVTNSVTEFKVTEGLALTGRAVVENRETEDVEFSIIEQGTTAEGAKIIENRLYADMPGDIVVAAQYGGVGSVPRRFTAKEEPVTEVVFLSGNSFPVNRSLSVIAEALPKSATYRDISLSIEGDNGVEAQLSSNVLTAKTTGIVTVRAETPGGTYAVMTILVEPASETVTEVTGISLLEDSFFFSRSLTLVPVVTPAEATAAVYFSMESDGGTGAVLKDGRLSGATRPGTIRIKAYTAGFETLLSVKAEKVDVETVYFTNENRFMISKGLNLKVTTIPTTPTYPEATFAIVSSTANGAKIGEGNILTATGVGEIVLCAYVDGVRSADFTVHADKVPVTDVQLTSTSKSFKYTESLLLEAIALPMQATYRNVEFSVDETGTTPGIGANIAGNVLTANGVGTVKVIMRCDGRDYPVFISVLKEPVIEIEDFDISLDSANAGETTFKTSGSLILTGAVYPDNATNSKLNYSLVFDQDTGDNAAQAALYDLGDNRIRLTAKFPGKIKVLAVSDDNEALSRVFEFRVFEEYVDSIHIAMKRDEAVSTAKAVEEPIAPGVWVESVSGADYYYFDEVFLRSKSKAGSEFSLAFDVFPFAQNRAVEPTYTDYELFYYKSYEDYLCDRGRISLSAQNPYFEYRAGKLTAKDKMTVVWIAAVSSHCNPTDREVISSPVKLTIYPVNILDLKKFRIDNETGIITSTTAGLPSEMNGYEITVKSNKFEFTKFLETRDTEIWLKLYKYSIRSYDVTVKAVYFRGDPDYEYKYEIPTPDFHGIQAVPKDQLVPITQSGQYCAVVVYDLYRTEYAFDVNLTFNEGVRFMYLYGNPAVRHTGLNFTFDHGIAPVEITLNGIRFAANPNKDAVRMNGDGVLTLNVIGRAELCGGKGDDGRNGTNGYGYSRYSAASRGRNGQSGDHSWNPFSDSVDGENGKQGSRGGDGGNGTDGADGRNGGFGIRLRGSGAYIANADNVIVNMAKGATLTLRGGDAGRGGDGGHGGNAQKGGAGGNGGRGGEKYAVMAIVCGKGGDGGRGGDGGNGGAGGRAGNAGHKGLSINSDLVKKAAGVTASDGNSAAVGSPGLGGSGAVGGDGGYGADGGSGVIVMVPYNGAKGSDGAKGTDGRSGANGSAGSTKPLSNNVND